MNIQIFPKYNFLIHILFISLLIVAAAAIWGFYSVLGKKIFRTEAEYKERGEKSISNIEIKYTMASFFFSCIPTTIILFFTDEVPSFFKYSGTEWLWILFMAFITTAFVFFIGIRKIEVSQGMSLALLKPIMVVILAYLIIGETASIALLVSIILVIAAVLLINRSKKPTN